jgi:hypothetical protein
MLKLRSYPIKLRADRIEPLDSAIWMILLGSCVFLDLTSQSVAATEEKEEVSSCKLGTSFSKDFSLEPADIPRLSFKNISLLEAIAEGESIQPIEQKPTGIFNPNDPLPRKVVPVEPPSDRPITPPSPPRDLDPIVLPKTPTATPGYLIAPRQLDLNKVNPFLTQITLNDVSTSHRTQYEVSGGIEAGNGQTANVGLSATGLFSPTVVESVSSDRIYRLEYRNGYSQVRSIRTQREIKTTIIEPETLLGMRQQISFVGDCLTPPNDATPQAGKQLCTFLPGLKTDQTSIDPERQVPTRLPQTSRFAEVVTPESLAAMKLPGFQAGANGQELGTDLYFPGIGTSSGNTQGTTATVKRNESTTTVPMVSFGRVRQIVATNGNEAALARTVRGFSYITGDRNTVLNTSIQAATELLPDIQPSLAPGQKGRSTATNRNLFLAANNNRVPENSFTAYYIGVGSGKTPSGNQQLAANYHGLWVGFSPIVDRNITPSSKYQPTGPERITLFAGGEGGVDSNVKVLAAIDSNLYSSSGIGNAYSQAYLTRLERDIDTHNTIFLQEKTNYYPHLSATGNITTEDSVLRYYAGLIFNPQSSSASNDNKVYGGIDFTKVESNGFSYNLSALGYVNPNPDYYSRVSGSVNKQFKLGNNLKNSFTLSTGFNYAFDGDSIYDSFNFRSGNSYLNLGAKANLGNISAGITYFIPNGMPNPIQQLLSVTGAWKISDGISTSAFYTPVNENSTRSPMGFNVSISLGSDSTSPTLLLGLNQNQFNFSSNSGNNVGVNNNVYTVYLRFGAPMNFSSK